MRNSVYSTAIHVSLSTHAVYLNYAALIYQEHKEQVKTQAEFPVPIWPQLLQELTPKQILTMYLFYSIHDS